MVGTPAHGALCFPQSHTGVLHEQGQRQSTRACAPDAATANITGTVAGGALRVLTRDGGAEDRREREPKTVQEVYKETYQTPLVRFCNVGLPTEVATMYCRLANCAKSELHTVLIQEFQRVCRWRGLATELYMPE